MGSGLLVRLIPGKFQFKAQHKSPVVRRVFPALLSNGQGRRCASNIVSLWVGVIASLLVITHAVGSEPDSVQSLLTQADQQYRASQLASAQVLLDKAFRLAPGDPRLSAQQAFIEDASGRYSDARQRYDELARTHLSDAVAVPSAVNLVLLGRLDDAQRAFAALARSSDAQLASYAGLWQLWLSARSADGRAHELQQQLLQRASHMTPTNAVQHELLELYAGRGIPERVMSAIDAMGVSRPIERSDLHTEAAFFAGGYLQYVRHDLPTALRLYQDALPHSSPASVELPVLRQAIAELQHKTGATR